MSDRRFAFLRAINVGKRRLTNAQLLEPFHAAGLDDVHAYQAAGNIAFRSSDDPRRLETRLDALIREAYGFDARPFVRTATELRTRLDDLPFAEHELATTERRIQVSFLATAPSADQLSDALALVPAEDLVVFSDREWFWLPRTGVSGSSLPVAQVERIVGPMTMRTVGTVERMLRRYPD